MRAFWVPMMLVLSSTMMATAWLGHLKFKASWGFWTALGVSWLIVLPEYVLNVAATRAGHGLYSGAQMASMHLSAGVVCVAIVSRFVLQEALTRQQYAGFGLMIVAIVLIMGWGPDTSG